MDVGKRAFSRQWRKAAKRLVCAVASAALAAGLMPAAAMAEVDSEGTTWYTLPSTPVSFDHTAADVNGNTGDYHYLSVAIASPGYTESSYYILGINDVTATKDLPAKTAVENGKVKSNVGKIGIMGTAANVNPDEYLYNYACYLNGADVPSTNYTSSGNISSVTINGTEYANFPRDIYMEVDMINKARTAAVSNFNYAYWVGLENLRENRPRNTPYDPKFVVWSTDSGGTAKMTNGLYTIAGIADKTIEESAVTDENGNVTYGLATRYAKGPETYRVVEKYEDLSKASQYYLISKFDSGKLKKAVAGVICGYDKVTKNYAVRILETGIENDKDSNSFGGRLSNCVASICDDITTKGLEERQQPYSANDAKDPDYVKWYSATDLIENCDALLVSDGTGGYLATASDGTRNSVTSSAVDPSENLDTLIAAQNEAKSAGKHYADICYRWPKHVFNVFYAQGCENVIMTLVSACFLYPTEFDLTNAMALWARDVWHIADSSLQDIVNTTCYSVSTSSSQTQLGTYTEAGIDDIKAKLNEGNAYYINHQAEIDAMHDGNIATWNIDQLKGRTTGWEKKAAVGDTATVGSSKVKITSTSKNTVSYTGPKSTSTKSVSVPATVKIDGATYKVATIAANAFKGSKATAVTIAKNVTGIGKNAFKGSSVKKVTLKTTKLTKKSVKGSLSGSKVTTVKAPSSKKKAYTTYFKKANSGKKVTVK